MNSTDYLERWLASGTITAAQHGVLVALVRRERQSVLVELHALTYVGVLAIAAGVAFIVSRYAEAWGPMAIIGALTCAVAAAAHYCVSRVPPYRHAQVVAPGLVFDYLLYLACLLFATDLAYAETQLHWLGERWDWYLLATAAVYFGVAYRFDNRFVLALAITSLGAWFGVRLQVAGDIGGDSRIDALIYGGVVAALGLSTHLARIKPHFAETYFHASANVVMLALLSGVMSSRTVSAWTLGLVLAASLSIIAGVGQRRFAFVAYGVVYGYVGLTRELLRGVTAPTVALLYVVASAVAVVMGLVTLARRMTRE